MIIVSVPREKPEDLHTFNVFFLKEDESKLFSKSIYWENKGQPAGALKSFITRKFKSEIKKYSETRFLSICITVNVSVIELYRKDLKSDKWITVNEWGLL